MYTYIGIYIYKLVCDVHVHPLGMYVVSPRTSELVWNACWLEIILILTRDASLVNIPLLAVVVCLMPVVILSISLLLFASSKEEFISGLPMLPRWLELGGLLDLLMLTLPDKWLMGLTNCLSCFWSLFMFVANEQAVTTVLSGVLLINTCASSRDNDRNGSQRQRQYWSLQDYITSLATMVVYVVGNVADMSPKCRHKIRVVVIWAKTVNFANIFERILISFVCLVWVLCWHLYIWQTEID